MELSKRRTQILQMVNTNGRMRASELAKELNVTTETIRKDLLYLNDMGLLEKNFGGAIAINESNERPLAERKIENVAEKTAIARFALSYIADNNVIFIDAGSTLVAFAELLPSDLNLTIVTNSFEVIPYLLKTSSVVYFIGGEVSGITMSTSGFWANQALDSIKIDVAFLGTSGFQSHSGPTSKQFTQAHIKQSIIKNSAKTIVLADHTKFVSNAVLQFADWADIDLLITDSNTPDLLVQTLQKSVTVKVVPCESGEHE